MGDATDQIWTNSCHYPLKKAGNLKSHQVFQLAQQHNRKSSGYRIVPTRNAYTFFHSDNFHSRGPNSIIHTSSMSLDEQKWKTLSKHFDSGFLDRISEVDSESDSIVNAPLPTAVATIEAKHEYEEVTVGNNQLSDAEPGKHDIIDDVTDEMNIQPKCLDTFPEEYDNFQEEKETNIVILTDKVEDDQNRDLAEVIRKKMHWLYQCPYRDSKRINADETVHRVDDKHQNRLEQLECLEDLFRKNNRPLHHNTSSDIPFNCQSQMLCKDMKTSNCNHESQRRKKKASFSWIRTKLKSLFNFKCLKVNIYHCFHSDYIL